MFGYSFARTYPLRVLWLHAKVGNFFRLGFVSFLSTPGRSLEAQAYASAGPCFPVLTIVRASMIHLMSYEVRYGATNPVSCSVSVLLTDLIAGTLLLEGWT